MRELCCLSCYLCYIEPFLTEEEKKEARAISFDCRCEFIDSDADSDLPPAESAVLHTGNETSEIRAQFQPDQSKDRLCFEFLFVRSQGWKNS